MGCLIGQETYELLSFPVEAERYNGDRTTVPVVGGILDKLVIQGHGPRTCRMECVIGFEYRLRTVVQRAVAYDESHSARGKKAALISGNCRRVIIGECRRANEKDRGQHTEECRHAASPRAARMDMGFAATSSSHRQFPLWILSARSQTLRRDTVSGWTSGYPEAARSLIAYSSDTRIPRDAHGVLTREAADPVYELGLEIAERPGLPAREILLTMNINPAPTSQNTSGPSTMPNITCPPTCCQVLPSPPPLNSGAL